MLSGYPTATAISAITRITIPSRHPITWMAGQRAVREGPGRVIGLPKVHIRDHPDNRPLAALGWWRSIRSSGRSRLCHRATRRPYPLVTRITIPDRHPGDAPVGYLRHLQDIRARERLKQDRYRHLHGPPSKEVSKAPIADFIERRACATWKQRGAKQLYPTRSTTVFVPSLRSRNPFGNRVRSLKSS